MPQTSHSQSHAYETTAIGHCLIRKHKPFYDWPDTTPAIL